MKRTGKTYKTEAEAWTELKTMTEPFGFYAPKMMSGRNWTEDGLFYLAESGISFEPDGTFVPYVVATPASNFHSNK